MIELLKGKFVKPDVSLIRTPYFYFQYPHEPRKLEMLADLIIKYQEIIADLRYYESYSTFSQRERLLFNELGIKVAKLEIDTNYINYKDIQNNELMTNSQENTKKK
ncbi:hypothetical protein GCM10008967_30070 [Bacillus carboniphilus]|uniref:Uncharacterized protein n=1 Tax=Bacillus carboniphilus TaxID=86663 RepID=A0ABP3G845_9BACI